jgi:hypothetical protein
MHGYKRESEALEVVGPAGLSGLLYSCIKSLSLNSKFFGRVIFEPIGHYK